MHVALLEHGRVERQLAGARLHQRQRRLRAFLHDVAELAGEDQLAAARQARGLDEQDVAAHRRPGEPSRHAGNAGAQRHLALEPARAEDARHVGRLDVHVFRLTTGDAHGGIAHDGADLALEIAAAGLPRVATHDRGERLVGEAQLLRLEAVRPELALDQVAFGDLELFFLGVAGQLDHLHAIAQRAGHGVEHVGGGDEQHLRQVEGRAQVIVAESRVLLGVEHLEQRRRRVALDAAAELVDLVEHDQRIARTGLADRLQDVARQRADVGAAMAADLGLVMHAAEADALELEAEGAGNALAERGLADAGRTDETQDRAAALGVELAHREKLEDASLDAVEPVVVGLEHSARVRHVVLLRVELRPGERDHQVEPGAQHGVLAT